MNRFFSLILFASFVLSGCATRISEPAEPTPMEKATACTESQPYTYSLFYPFENHRYVTLLTVIDCEQENEARATTMKNRAVRDKKGAFRRAETPLFDAYNFTARKFKTDLDIFNGCLERKVPALHETIGLDARSSLDQTAVNAAVEGCLPIMREYLETKKFEPYYELREMYLKHYARAQLYGRVRTAGQGARYAINNPAPSFKTR